MHCLRVRACFAIIFGLVAACSFAEEPESDLTADELIVKASAFYAGGKYKEAAEHYGKFITDFGLAPEAQTAIRQMRYPLAMCLVRLQDFAEALVVIDGALASAPPPETAHLQELFFWKGVCQIQQEQSETARATLERFLGLFPDDVGRNSQYVRQFPAALKVPEARLLIGACLLLEGRPADAADYCARSKGNMAPVNRGRATILQTHALVEADKDDEALKVVREEFSRMGELVQLMTFQTLTFELGTRFLERNKPREAIVCLQRVWPAQRLLKHQQARLEDLESKLRAAEAGPRGDPYARLLYGQMIAKVKREIENFRRIESFDAAVRLRLAAAYQAMERYREAALIIDAMVNELPTGPIIEAASVNLVQSWSALECWPKVVEAAVAFTKRFPTSAQVPLVEYLHGIALQRSGRHREAVAIFEGIERKHPSSDLSPRARFMSAFCLLQATENKEAVAAFQRFEEKYPRHELKEEALYWRGVAWSLQGEFERCREMMEDYSQKYQDGRHRASASFRKAYCAQQMKDYATSITELEDFLRYFPMAEECNEARLLLGDALMAQGRLDEGMAALRGVSPDNARLYAEGIFKIGKAFKMMEDYEGLRQHMAKFVSENPRTPRAAEAVYWIGWTHRQQSDPQSARNVYWRAINEHGDDASMSSIDDLFPALSKLYRGNDEQAEYTSQLGSLRREAERGERKTLALRTSWAQALASRKRDPAQAQAGLVEISTQINAQIHSPAILADCADALIASGRKREAEQLYRELLKWHPRAPQKDRALLTIGRLEIDYGKPAQALQLFERFEREVVGSPLFGATMLDRAKILQTSGHATEARRALEKLLASEYAIGKEKAEALYLIGELHMGESRPDLAIPYFQRLYVMYGRWRDWVAKAYFRSGEAFEKLDDELSARKTYQELSEREDLAGFEETGKARLRLEALGGPFPSEKRSSTGG